MRRDPAAESRSIVSRDRVIDVIRTELRITTQVERRLTTEQIAAASGVLLRTVRSYMENDEGAREPCLSSALSLAVVLGPRCLNAILALIGYTARALDEPDAIEPMQLTATAMRHLSTIATAAADGRIDHTEQPVCREAADIIIATVLPLSSAGQAA